jgi:hypothetical protein
MPGDDVPLSPLAWRLLFHLRTTPRAHPEHVTASELFAAHKAARKALAWRLCLCPSLRQALAELLRHGYVEALDGRPGPAAARAAPPPPYRLTPRLAEGDTGLGLPSMARTFLTRLRAAPERVLTAEDIAQAEVLAGVLDAEAGARLVRAAIAALVDAGYLVPARQEVPHGRP